MFGLEDIVGYLIGAIAFVAVFFGYGAVKKHQGRTEERSENLAEVKEKVNEANKAPKGVAPRNRAD